MLFACETNARLKFNCKLTVVQNLDYICEGRCALLITKAIDVLYTLIS